MTWLEERLEKGGHRNIYSLHDRSIQAVQLELLDQIHERLIEIRNLLHDPAEDQP